MNHYVPDFEMDDDYTIPTSSSLTRPKKSAMADDEIMELLWQNGQVVMQSQTQQRSLKKPAPPPPPHSKYDDGVLPTDHPSREIRPGPPGQPHQQQLFMQEDEMASWLHYPLHEANFDQDICAADLLFPPPTSTTSAAAAPCITTATASNFRYLEGHDPRAVSTSASRPPIPPSRRPEVVQNFSLFSRHRGAPAAPPLREPSESVPSNLRSAVARESTVVDSSDTPTPAAVASEARTSAAARSTTAGASSGGDNACGAVSCAVLAGTSSAPAIGASNINTTATATTNTNTNTNNDNNNNNNSSREMGMTSCEMTVTSSSPGGSSASASAEPPLAAQKPSPPEDRKRKGKDEDADWHSEDAEFESGDAKKQARRSTSTKRSRAAEVHNLSERRRRDRINEKMRALQELIPRCNKSDKASMLDEAIEYLKSLQLQVQMMSMGCGMVPMMFPGVQQYMPPMGMGMSMGMGMGMGMDMSMSRPMMPFPNVLAGAPTPTPATAAHLGPRFPMPAFHMPPAAAAAAAAVPDPSRIQAANQSDPMLSSLGAQNPNQPRVPNFVDPYQQFLSLYQMQLPVLQNQVGHTSASRGAENLENNQSGT